MAEARKSRPIRLLDEEWDIFKRCLGTEWLRQQIRKALKREQREKGNEQN